MPHPAQEAETVGLELHPGAAAVAEPAAGQRPLDGGPFDPDPGGQALQDGGEGRSVALSREQGVSGPGVVVAGRAVTICFSGLLFLRVSRCAGRLTGVRAVVRAR